DDFSVLLPSNGCARSPGRPRPVPRDGPEGRPRARDQAATPAGSGIGGAVPMFGNVDTTRRAAPAFDPVMECLRSPLARDAVPLATVCAVPPLTRAVTLAPVTSNE